MKPKHGMTGQQNAMKGSEPATERLIVRCTPTMKKIYQEEAKAQGLNLSEWVIRVLNEQKSKSEISSLLDELEESVCMGQISKLLRQYGRYKK